MATLKTGVAIVLAVLMLVAGAVGTQATPLQTQDHIGKHVAGSNTHTTLTESTDAANETVEKNETIAPMALSNGSQFISSQYSRPSNPSAPSNKTADSLPPELFSDRSAKFDDAPGALELYNRTRLSKAIHASNSTPNASGAVVYYGGGETSKLDGTSVPGSNTTFFSSRSAGSSSDSTSVFNSTANSGIIGDDGRMQIEQTDAYPWSSVTELQIVTQDGQLGRCSGAIIREENSTETSYHMLTAAHCVYFPEQGGFIQTDGPDASRVVPAADGSAQPFGTVGIERIRTYEGWTTSLSPAYDIALVTLERRIGERTGSLQYTAGSPGSSIYQHDETTVVGYPGDQPAHTMWTDTGTGGGSFDGGQTGDLPIATHRYQMDIYSGMSGGPVWIQDHPSIDGRQIVSVNSYAVDSDRDGQTDFNMGTRLTHSRVEDFERWMGVDDGEGLMNDRFEPNDDIASATPVGAQEELRDLRIIDGEFDVFAVDLEQGEEILSEISFEHETGDLDMRLLAPNESIIDESMSTTDDETVDAQSVGQSGTYYIVVDGRNETSVPYSLSVNSTIENDEIEQDRLEPNDQFVDPTMIEQESTVLNNLSVTTGDADIFAVELSEGSDLTANISFDHSTGDLNLALLTPGRNVIDQSTSMTDTEQVTVSESTSAGKYYILVYGFSGATAPYSLSIEHQGLEPTEPTNDRFEPNDVVNTASPVEGDTRFKDLQIVNGEYDIFSFHLAEGDDLNATIDFEHGTGNLDLGLLGPNLQEVENSVSTTDGENASVADVSRNGTYYVVIYGYDGASAPYDLSIEQTGNLDNAKDIRLEPQSQTIPTGSTTMSDIYVERVTHGVGSYNYTIEVGNATVSQIRDVSLAGDPGVRDVDVSEDNSSVTVVGALADTVDRGAVQIGTITLTGQTVGETTLNLSVTALSDEQGRTYTIGDVFNGTVVVTNVSGPGDVTGDGRSATDPDGDRRYEDVNGDGEFSVIDIQALFANRDSTAIEEQPRAFDYNGDGEFNVIDVQALFNQLD